MVISVPYFCNRPPKTFPFRCHRSCWHVILAVSHRLHSIPEQRELLEELQRAYDYAQMEELEAMFLASFDQCKALALSHCA